MVLYLFCTDTWHTKYIDEISQLQYCMSFMIRSLLQKRLSVCIVFGLSILVLIHYVQWNIVQNISTACMVDEKRSGCYVGWSKK